jgi:retinol-binding protein 3
MPGTNSRWMSGAVCCVLLVHQPARAQRATETPARTATEHALDSRMVRSLIDTVSSQIERLYVDADTAKLIARSLRTRYESGAYAHAYDENQLAELMTTDLRSVNHDLHLSVRFAAGNARDARTGAVAFLDRDHHYALGRVDVLPGNIGYLELNGFAIDGDAESMLVEALKYLGSTDAVILDLRRNRGGSGELSNFLISHFTGPDTIASLKVSSRQTDMNFTRYTLASVPGPRRPDVPVYVLTSRRTASAGEDFSFVMQNLKRATLVGDRTAGAGHNVTAVPSGGGFQTFISITRVSDPRTGKEWEQVGVQPDVRVDPSTALDVAQSLALERLAAKATGDARERLTFLHHVREAMLHPHPVSNTTLQNYAGDYDGDRHVRVANGRLLYEAPSGTDADTLVALSDSVFAASTQARLIFAHAEGGGVALHIRTPEGSDIIAKRKIAALPTRQKS